MTEGLQAGLRPTEDQRMHIMGTFIGIDGFQIDHVSHDMIIGGNAICAMHIASGARDIEGFAAAIAFDQRDHLRRGAPFVEQSADPQAGLQ